MNRRIVLTFGVLSLVLVGCAPKQEFKPVPDEKVQEARKNIGTGKDIKPPGPR